MKLSHETLNRNSRTRIKVSTSCRNLSSKVKNSSTSCFSHWRSTNLWWEVKVCTGCTNLWWEVKVCIDCTNLSCDNGWTHLLGPRSSASSRFSARGVQVALVLYKQKSKQTAFMMLSQCMTLASTMVQIEGLTGKVKCSKKANASPEYKQTSPQNISK